LDTLRRINQVYAAVSFTVTTADDALGKQVEPGAALVSERFSAMRVLAANGILTGVTMMPILPFLEDSEENIRAIVAQARASGASYIVPAFGMTLRDRQRAYYYAQLDRLFPGVRQQYERRFGDRYECAANNATRLKQVFQDECDRNSISTSIPQYAGAKTNQPNLF
jgi:DNA repair photolyase